MDCDYKYEKKLNNLVLNVDLKETIAQILMDLLNSFHAFLKGDRVRQVFASLFEQHNMSYTDKLLENLPIILSKITSPNTEDSESESPDSVYKKHIMELIKDKWKKYKFNGWRKFSILLKAIPECQGIFNVLEFNNFYLQDLVGIFKAGNKEMQKLASDSMCQLIVHNHYSKTRRAVLESMIVLSKSQCCFDRNAFLVFIDTASVHFSRKFLQEEGLMERYLALGEDKVLNNRLKFVGLATKINNVVVQEEARNQLLFSLKLLQNDLSKEVRRVANEARQIIEESKGVNEMNIKEDQEKEDRERNLYVREKEEETALLLKEEEAKNKEKLIIASIEETKKKIKKKLTSGSKNDLLGHKAKITDPNKMASTIQVDKPSVKAPNLIKGYI